MRFTRAAVWTVGTLVLACSDHAATAPRTDELPEARTRLAADRIAGSRFEPAGYKLITERAFGTKARTINDTVRAEGWDAGEYRYAALSVVRDASAPQSAPSVMQVSYERRTRGGDTLARVAKPLTENPRQIYASLWIELSSNWRGSGDLASVSIGGVPRLTLHLDSRGSAQPVISAFVGTTLTDRQPVTVAPSAATVTRASWHRIELVAKTNTPGQSDGILDLWVDGLQTVKADSVRYVKQAESDIWQQFSLEPTWGVPAERLSQTMFMWWDHVYVSGSSSTAAPVIASTALATAATDNAIFSDGFESGDLSAWQDGVNPTNHQVLTDSALAHSGTHLLDMTYPAGQSGRWLTRFFMPGFDSVYVSYWMRLDPNWAGTTKLLTLRGSRTDDQWSGFGRAGECPTGSDFFATSVALGSPTSNLDLSFSTYYPGMPRSADGVSCFGQSQGAAITYAATRRLTVGAWHKIEFWVKLNTVGNSDGMQRTWLDGQLVGEWTGLTLRTDNALELNSLMLDGEAIAPITEHLYIDDVQVLPAMPGTTPPPPAPVASVAVTLNASTLTIGQSTQAVAKLTDANGNILSGRTVSWSSSNTSVATVDANGLVSAIAAGAASISATAEGITGAATVTVTRPVVASVTVTLNAPSLTIGQSTQAAVALRDANGNVLTGRLVTWSSSNASIATVDANGLVTAVAAGTAAISATSEGVSGSAQLVVTAPSPTDNSVFSEGFESGTLASWQDQGSPTRHTVLTDASLAHSGTHALQMTYPAGQGGGWLTRFFMPGSDSLYASYWVRLDPNWTGATTLLTLRGSRTDDQWSAFGRSTDCPTGSDFFATTIKAGTSTNPLDLTFLTWYPGMAKSADGVTCTGVGQGMGTVSYAAARRLSVGVWHRLDFWVKLNTVGQSNGQQAMWLDGQLVGQWSGLTFRTDNALKLNSLMLDGATASSQTRVLYIDDISVGQPTGALPLPPPPSGVASVTVTLNSPSLTVGQSTQATATLRDASGGVLSGPTVTWSSSNAAVATVNAQGLVTAVGAGTATITATSQGVTGAATLIVNAPAPAPVTSVSVTLNSPSLAIGQSTQAVATLRDAAGNVLTGRAISWSSSNSTVATVDANGLVSSVAAGSTNIIATSEGVTGSATLTVTASPVASVTVAVNPDTLTPGQTAQASAILKDASGNVLTGRTVTWSSSNLVAASISATGLITALAAGTTTITATSGGVSGSVQVVVMAVPVASVTVSLGASSLIVGQTTQATAVLKDASGNVLTGRTISWSSTNTAVATVSATGLVTAVAAGSAGITATAEGQSGTANMSVTTPPPPGSWPNEPLGFRTFTDVDWSTLTPGGGWNTNTGTRNAAITADAAAPFSPPSVFQITFPTGFAGGSDPVKYWFDALNGEQPTELYYAQWIKVSNPWQGHSSGVNKIIFFNTGNTTESVLMVMFGSGTPYRLRYEIEFNSATYWLTQNVANPEFTLGTWHLVEVYMKYGANSTGIFRSWFDGAKVMEYTNMAYPNNGFGEIQIAPVWGGIGDTKNETDFYWIDHIHVSRP